jgi:hypothetical protein
MYREKCKMKKPSKEDFKNYVPHSQIKAECIFRLNSYIEKIE